MKLKKSRKRGRPTISDDDLRGNRNHLFQLFDTHWADFGWQLANLASIEAVPTALAVLPSDSSQYVIKLLLRPVNTQTSPETARVLYKRLREIPEGEKKIRDDVGETQKAISTVESMLAEPIEDLERRLLTRDREKYLAELSEKNAQIASLREKHSRIRQELETVHAHFAKSQLIDFRKKHRSRLNPRRLANALAGLPYIAHRQSAHRCTDLEEHKAVGGYYYEIFRIILRIVKSFDRKLTWDGNADLIMHAKSYIQSSRSTSVRYFSDLCDNWRDLRLSIEQVVLEQPDPEARAYRIASEYFKRTGRSPTPKEIYLSNREKLKRAKIKTRIEKYTGLPPVSADDKP